VNSRSETGYGDDRAFEVHWTRRGFPRKCIRDREKIERGPNTPLISGLREDQFGGLVGLVQAGSAEEAWLIAQDHALCLFMGVQSCAHVRLAGFSKLSASNGN
jgi:hypothetical protein